MMPKADLTMALRRDYAEMQEIIVGGVPSFDDVLSAIETFEVEINA